MIQDKAQFAGNGRALFKDCDAVLDHLTCSLRASREAIIPKGHEIRGVAPLGKGTPLPARRALRRTASRLAERTNITLLDH
jgi:hypothetical protein